MSRFTPYFFQHEREHIRFFSIKNTCGTHLSIYTNSGRRVQSCALYVNFPCRMVSRLKSLLSESLQMTLTGTRSELMHVCLSWNLRCPCLHKALRIIYAHCASVSICFVAGDKTGSKLFLLVQQQKQQQQLERCSERKSAASSCAPGAHSRQRSTQSLPSELRRLSSLNYTLLVCFVCWLCYSLSPGYILNFKSLQTQGGACTCTNKTVYLTDVRAVKHKWGSLI